MLTRRMRDVLRFIDVSQRQTGVGVSVRDIRDFLGHKTTSTAHKTLVDLRVGGYIVNSRYGARTIEVIRRPGDVDYRVFDFEDKRLGPLIKFNVGASDVEKMKRTAR